mgnify:CR=1 FL=1
MSRLPRLALLLLLGLAIACAKPTPPTWTPGEGPPADLVDLHAQRVHPAHAMQMWRDYAASLTSTPQFVVDVQSGLPGRQGRLWGTLRVDKGILPGRQVRLAVASDDDVDPVWVERSAERGLPFVVTQSRKAQFAIGGLAPGTYALSIVVDANADGVFDEAHDAFTIVPGISLKKDQSKGPIDVVVRPRPAAAIAE